MKNIFYLLSGLLLLVSCGKLVTRASVTVQNKIFRLHHYSNVDKELVFVPMIHVNTAERFKQIKHKVDSLRALGYVIMYEGINIRKPLDSLEIITVYRKFKNVTGSLPSDYFDKRNKQFRSLAVKGFILQTHENTGVNPKTDIQADLPMDTLVALYEKEKGEIVLSECDWKTGLLEKYKCKKVSKEDTFFIVEALRNRYIGYVIANSNAKKMAIVYGSRHSIYLERELQKHDSLWKFIKISSPLPK